MNQVLYTYHDAELTKRIGTYRFEFEGDKARCTPYGLPHYESPSRLAKVTLIQKTNSTLDECIYMYKFRGMKLYFASTYKLSEEVKGDYVCPTCCWIIRHDADTTPKEDRDCKCPK